MDNEENELWDGDERRSGEDRRTQGERRKEERTIFDRRSGHDRRGHPLYQKDQVPDPESESQVG